MFSLHTEKMRSFSDLKLIAMHELQMIFLVALVYQLLWYLVQVLNTF